MYSISNTHVSSTFLKEHRYPLSPIWVGSIYMHIFICNVFLITQHVPHPPKGGDGCTDVCTFKKVQDRLGLVGLGQNSLVGSVQGSFVG